MTECKQYSYGIYDRLTKFQTSPKYRKVFAKIIQNVKVSRVVDENIEIECYMGASNKITVMDVYGAKLTNVNASSCAGKHSECYICEVHVLFPNQKDHATLYIQDTYNVERNGSNNDQNLDICILDLLRTLFQATSVPLSTFGYFVSDVLFDCDDILHNLLEEEFILTSSESESESESENDS